MKTSPIFLGINLQVRIAVEMKNLMNLVEMFGLE